jgi:hypothetical protein
MWTFGCVATPIGSQVQLTEGTELVPLQLPWKPKLVLAPAESEPLLLVLVAVTDAPDWVRLVFQELTTVWPLAKVQVTVQLDSPEDPAVTVTLPMKPPWALLPLVHWEATE